MMGASSKFALVLRNLCLSFVRNAMGKVLYPIPVLGYERLKGSIS